jgi:hypothetical protein
VQLVVRLLGQPDDASVRVEVVVPQHGPAVQPELLLHRAREGSDQEVGEEVRARLLLEERLDAGRPGKHVVAVQARQAVQAEVGADVVERAVRAAIGVADGHPPVRVAQALGQLPDLGGDLLRLVVQQRRQRIHVDRPGMPFADLGGRLGDRPAGDQRCAL